MDAKRIMSRGSKKRSGPGVSLDCTGSLEGWRTVVLENELLRVVVLPEYGGWILDILYKPRQVNLLWRSPRGLIHKDDPPVVPEASLGFRARSPGGWPELFPHGSGAADVRGARMPFHGEVVNRVWRFELVESPAGEVAVRLCVDCHLLPLRLERTLRLRAGRSTLTVEEKVTNRAGIPIDFMWGHHPYYGKPVLSAASRIFAPASSALDDDFAPRGWPMHEGRDLSICPAEGSRSGDMFYLTGLAAGWYALVNPLEELGVALSWDPQVFPFVWIWSEANRVMDYPYFGGAYAVAIEPFSSLPGARQRGERLLMLDGGASLETRLAFTAFEGLDRVAGVSRDGDVSA